MSTTDNYQLIEGDFKNFTIRRILPEDHERVIQHLKEHFVNGEVTMRTMGMNEQSTTEFGEICRAAMNENYSFLVEEKDTKEVACLRLTFIEKQNVDIFKNVKIESRQMKLLLGMFAELDALAKVYETFGVNEYVFFFVASTDPKFRNQGLTREMYARNLRFLKREGRKICKVFTSSPYSRAATKTNGFKEIGRVDYENLKDPEGNPIFNLNDLTPEHFCSVKVFNLQEH